MKVDVATGLLGDVCQVASPNFDKRPAPDCIDLLVVHGISLPPGEYGGPYIDALFTNALNPRTHPYFRTIQGLQVSAHALVRRDGSVTQYVPFHLRAWHAGESCFESRSRCNDFSIGIELEGSDEMPYTDAQYTALVQLAHALMEAYPALNVQRIVGHADIAPGRKMDPGAAFDWERLRALLA